MSRVLKKILLIWIVAGFLACDDGSFATHGENEKKIVNPAFNGHQQNSKPKRPAFRSRYKFIAKLKNLRLKVCDGDAVLTAFSDLSSQMSGIVPCTGGRDMNLGEAQTKGVRATDAVAKTLPLFGYFERVASSGQIQYNPPVVDMVVPIINRPQEYQGLASTEKLTVTKRKQDGFLKTFRGIMITESKIVRNFKPEDYPETFPQVVHFSRKLDDFDKDMNFGEFGLYKEIEFWVQPKPFVITQIVLRGKLKDFVSEPGPDQTEEDFTSKLGLNLEVTMTLRDHQTFLDQE